MRKVIDFVVRFLPTGLFACSSRPLIDAALDLMANVQSIDIQVGARNFDPYHSEYKGNSFEWDRVKLFIKDNADVLLVLEPRDIDSFLDYGVLIRMTWALARVEIL